MTSNTFFSFAHGPRHQGVACLSPRRNNKVFWLQGQCHFKNLTISVLEYSSVIEFEPRFEVSSATYQLCEYRQVTYLL